MTRATLEYFSMMAAVADTRCRFSRGTIAMQSVATSTLDRSVFCVLGEVMRVDDLAVLVGQHNRWRYLRKLIVAAMAPEAHGTLHCRANWVRRF